MEYNVGDKVRITTDKSKSIFWNGDGDMDKWLGKVMTIRSELHVFGKVIYKMEEDKDEHSYLGWNWHEEMIDGLAEDKPKYQINIESDGKTTTATLSVDGKEVKKGVAKCSPEDKFKLKVGVDLALERMWGNKEKKWYFSKEKYIEDMGLNYLSEWHWANEIDGKLAKFDECDCGICSPYIVRKIWCVQK